MSLTTALNNMMHIGCVVNDHGWWHIPEIIAAEGPRVKVVVFCAHQDFSPVAITHFMITLINQNLSQKKTKYIASRISVLWNLWTKYLLASVSLSTMKKHQLALLLLSTMKKAQRHCQQKAMLGSQCPWCEDYTVALTKMSLLLLMNFSSWDMSELSSPSRCSSWPFRHVWTRDRNGWWPKRDLLKQKNSERRLKFKQIKLLLFCNTWLNYFFVNHLQKCLRNKNLNYTPCKAISLSHLHLQAFSLNLFSLQSISTSRQRLLDQ